MKHQETSSLHLGQAARELGLQPAQLYAWRAKAQQQGQDDEMQRLQQAETARLKRALARLEEENAFLKKRRSLHTCWRTVTTFARSRNCRGMRM